jgi:hypothetical protein
VSPRNNFLPSTQIAAAPADLITARNYCRIGILADHSFEGERRLNSAIMFLRSPLQSATDKAWVGHCFAHGLPSCG